MELLSFKPRSRACHGEIVQRLNDTRLEAWRMGEAGAESEREQGRHVEAQVGPFNVQAYPGEIRTKQV